MLSEDPHIVFYEFCLMLNFHYGNTVGQVNHSD